MPKTAKKPVWIAPYVNKSNNCYYYVPLWYKENYWCFRMDVDFSRVEELVHSIRPMKLDMLGKDDE